MDNGLKIDLLAKHCIFIPFRLSDITFYMTPFICEDPNSLTNLGSEGGGTAESFASDHVLLGPSL